MNYINKLKRYVLSKLIKLIIVLICLLTINNWLYSQRSWEGVTLEFEANEYAPKDIGPKSILNKFWMEFEHGVVKISNSNNVNIESYGGLTAYYYGSYVIDENLLSISINQRLFHSEMFRTLDFTGEVLKFNKLYPDSLELSQDYKFLISEVTDLQIELKALESFFVIKDNPFGNLKETDKLRAIKTIRFDIGREKYKWFSIPELLKDIEIKCNHRN